MVGNGDGTFVGVNALTIANGASYVVAADLNRDTVVDAIVAKGAEGLVPLVRTASAIAAVAPPVTVPATGFSFVLNPASGTVTSGASVQTVVAFTFPAGFSDPVSLHCAGLPANARCTFSSATVTPATSTSTTVTIETGVTPTASARRQDFGGRGTGLAVVGFGSLGLVGASVRRRRRPRGASSRLATLLVGALIACGLVAGCNDGGNSDPPPAVTTAPPVAIVTTTPSGSYAVSIIATAGSNTQTAIFALTVR